MATKTRRLETRLDERTAEMLSRAAALEGESVSGFVIRAARRQAEDVLARHDQTLVSEEQFTRMVAALDGPVDVVPELERVARRPRRFSRSER